MGSSPSKPGPALSSDLATTPAPETTCTKEDQESWQVTMTGLEKDISEETDNPYRQNLQACLDWLKKYGYPNPGYVIWAFDGVARCQKRDEAAKYRSTIPGFFDRLNESVIIRSPTSMSIGGEDGVITRN